MSCRKRLESAGTGQRPGTSGIYQYGAYLWKSGEFKELLPADGWLCGCGTYILSEEGNCIIILFLMSRGST